MDAESRLSSTDEVGMDVEFIITFVVELRPLPIDLELLDITVEILLVLVLPFIIFLALDLKVYILVRNFNSSKCNYCTSTRIQVICPDTFREVQLAINVDVVMIPGDLCLFCIQ